MGAMSRAKTVLDKMIAAMNRGGDAAKRVILRAKDIERFAKPKPKKAGAPKKGPLPLRASMSSKKAKKPRRKKIVKKRSRNADAR
jgi:hypothetical protein